MSKLVTEKNIDCINVHFLVLPEFENIRTHGVTNVNVNVISNTGFILLLYLYSCLYFRFETLEYSRKV